MAEARGSVAARAYWERVDWNSEIQGVLGVGVSNESLDIWLGQGPVDIRELNVGIRIGDTNHLKIGRQVISWGVADFLVVNDVFPKDYRSVLMGRGEQFLNAPTDALRISVPRGVVNIDFVYTPAMVPDRYVDGRRLSYWNPVLGSMAGSDSQMPVAFPRSFPETDEWAARVYGFWGSREWSLYFTDGLTHSPSSVRIADRAFSFVRQRTFGASARGALGDAVLFAEGAFFDRTQLSGTIPLLGDELRVLAGVTYPLPGSIDATIQGYWENHDNGLQQAEDPPRLGSQEQKSRTLITGRFARSFFQDDLWLNFLAVYSPSDRDYLVFPNVSYRVSNFKMEGGLSVMGGPMPETPFGQFELADNAHMSVSWYY
ncbi:hypothetical protein ACFL5T_03625 [Gemmatimonadota bacterium]